jgi:hypothetical protein
MGEERVNEFPRESLPKSFSYAVAALSKKLLSGAVSELDLLGRL